MRTRRPLPMAAHPYIGMAMRMPAVVPIDPDNVPMRTGYDFFPRRRRRTDLDMQTDMELSKGRNGDRHHRREQKRFEEIFHISPADRCWLSNLFNRHKCRRTSLRCDCRFREHMIQDTFPGTIHYCTIPKRLLPAVILMRYRSRLSNSSGRFRAPSIHATLIRLYRSGKCVKFFHTFGSSFSAVRMSEGSVNPFSAGLRFGRRTR